MSKKNGSEPKRHEIFSCSCFVLTRAVPSTKGRVREASRRGAASLRRGAGPQGLKPNRGGGLRRGRKSAARVGCGANLRSRTAKIRAPALPVSACRDAPPGLGGASPVRLVITEQRWAARQRLRRLGPQGPEKKRRSAGRIRVRRCGGPTPSRLPLSREPCAKGPTPPRASPRHEAAQPAQERACLGPERAARMRTRAVIPVVASAAGRESMNTGGSEKAWTRPAPFCNAGVHGFRARPRNDRGEPAQNVDDQCKIWLKNSFVRSCCGCGKTRRACSSRRSGRSP